LLDDPPDFGHASAYLAADGIEDGAYTRVAARAPLCDGDLHGHCGENRADPVVQVAADPATLLLARHDKPFPGPLEVLNEVGDLRSDRGMDCDVTQQPSGPVSAWCGP
jgi:hypothetical protein